MILKPSDAYKALMEGKKIRRRWWTSVEYIYYDKDKNDIKFDNGSSAKIDVREFIDKNSEFGLEPTDQWILYEENKWIVMEKPLVGGSCTIVGCPKCNRSIPYDERKWYIYCPFCGSKNIER